MIGKLLFIFFTILVIYTYVSILQEHNLEKYDPFNVTLLQLDICGWNLFHVICYFVVCVFFRVKTLTGYLSVFLAGIGWYFLEQLLFHKYNQMDSPNSDGYKLGESNSEESKSGVYDSISMPRVDDLFYNGLGIFLYFLTHAHCETLERG